jgi:hypothetical protein
LLLEVLNWLAGQLLGEVHNKPTGISMPHESTERDSFALTVYSRSLTVIDDMLKQCDGDGGATFIVEIPIVSEWPAPNYCSLFMPALA